MEYLGLALCFVAGAMVKHGNGFNFRWIASLLLAVIGTHIFVAFGG